METLTVVILPNIGEPNGNNRIYSHDLVEKMVEDYHKRPTDVVGRIGMSYAGENTDFSMVSHIVKNIFVEDNALKADIEILETIEGKRLQQLLRDTPDAFVFRTSGIGKSTLHNNGTQDVTEFALTGVHLVPQGDAA